MFMWNIHVTIIYITYMLTFEKSGHVSSILDTIVCVCMCVSVCLCKRDLYHPKYYNKTKQYKYVYIYVYIYIYSIYIYI